MVHGVLLPTCSTLTSNVGCDRRLPGYQAIPFFHLVGGYPRNGLVMFPQEKVETK